MCFVRALLGEETRAFTFHRGPLLLLLSLKTERTRQGSGHIPSPSAAAPERARPAPQRTARSQRSAGHPCRDPQGPSRAVFFLHFMDSLWHIPLPPRSGCPVSILPRRHRAAPTGRRSRRCPARVPWPTCANARPGSFPAAPDAPAPRSRTTREELPGTPGTHASHPAAAELQVPQSLARRARGCMSKEGAGLTGARSVAGRTSGPAPAPPRLAEPGPAPRAAVSWLRAGVAAITAAAAATALAAW